MNNENFDKKGVTRAMVIALIFTLAGLGVLGWQYRQLESKRFLALENKIEEQKKEMEIKSAQNVLDVFMTARISGNKDQILLYLTENATKQNDQGDFSLINDLKSFEVLNSEEINEDEFRFSVKSYMAGIGDFVEVILLKKILNNYYIDSVEMAG